MPKPKRKFNPMDDKAMEDAERCYAKSSAIMAGAARLLTDHIANTSWGTDIVLDICIVLLQDAKSLRDSGGSKASAVKRRVR